MCSRCFSTLLPRNDIFIASALRLRCNIVPRSTAISYNKGNLTEMKVKAVVFIKVFCIFHFSRMYIHKGQLHLSYHISLSKCILTLIITDSSNLFYYLYASYTHYRTLSLTAFLRRTHPCILTKYPERNLLLNLKRSQLFFFFFAVK